MGATTTKKTIILLLVQFQFMRPRWAQHLNTTIGCNDYKISIHAPRVGATARFRYYLAFYTIFSIYISFLYTIIYNHHLIFLLFRCESSSVFMFALHSHLNHLILGNVLKKVFRYSSGLFNIIFHIVFISLQMRTFCFARVIAV